MGAYGIITATVVGPGDQNEAHRLRDLIEAHQEHTRHNVEVVEAGSKYGTTANFFDRHDHGIATHVPALKQTQDQQERRRKIFPESQFIYDPQIDTYRCPAGRFHGTYPPNFNEGTCRTNSESAQALGGTQSL